MGVNSSKLGKKGGASASLAAPSTIENRQIVRKANKEDLFTFVTYSILSDNAVTDQVFAHWKKKDRKSKARYPQLLAELQAMAASVVCLQAVDGTLYEELLKPEMAKLGYEASMLRLSGKKTDANRTGVATFFHSGTFRLLKTHNIKLNDTMKDAAKAARLDPRSAGLLNNSEALVLLLQLLPDKHAKQHCVVVANSELCASATADVQALEAALLLRELQSYAEHVHSFKTDSGMSDVGVGYIVAGDLGAGPKSPQYSLLKRGSLDIKDDRKLRKCPQVSVGTGRSSHSQPLVDWFRGSFTHNWSSLKSAYATVVGQEPANTVFSDQGKACRDYVWFTGDNLNANSALQAPSQATLEQAGGIPNASYPSDHIPLCIGFRFKKSDVFTSVLPFDGAHRAAASPGSDGGDEQRGNEQEVDDLAPRNLDDILGFKMPTDKTRYDRFGRERHVSGISTQEDLAPSAWKAAESRRY